MRIILLLLLLVPLAAADDVNGDGTVDLQDLLVITQHYGRVAGFDASADRNSDGRIDLFDLVLSARHWGSIFTEPDTAGGPFFTDDFENYSEGETVTGAGENGFVWGGSSADLPTISGEVSRSGGSSLRFPFGPYEPGGSPHWWSEQRFALGRNLSEAWTEHYLYFPDGTEGSGARFEMSTNSNNKFLALWGDDYSRSARATYELWQVGENDAGAMVFIGSQAPDERPGALVTVVTNDTRGRWVRWREHVRVSSALGASDGLVESWLDDELLERVEGIPIEADNASYSLDLRQGYLLGYDNARYTNDTYIYIDDFSVWEEDPGWERYPNEPAGMTVVGRADGSVVESDGNALGIAAASGWYHEPYITLVSDPDNPTGSGSALEFLYPQGTSSGPGGMNIQFGPYTHLYVYSEIRLLDGGWDTLSPKYFYLQTEGGRPWGSHTWTGTSGWNGSHKGPYVINAIDDEYWATWRGTSQYVFPMDEWVELEWLFVAESSVGAGDGEVYAWVDGQPINADTSWRHSPLDDTVGPRFGALQLYGHANEVAVDTRYQMREFYVSGR